MLTPRQQAVFDFVQRQRDQAGVFPTIREIQAYFGFASPFAVTRHLAALAAKGVLHRDPGKARAFTTPASLSRAARALRDIPLYGTIPAGLPTATEQEPDSVLTVDATALGLPSRVPLFALRVRGDSMIDAHILDGDTVFLTPGDPRPGQVVAALIDGETTLKHYLVQRGRPFLRAANPRYPDLLPATELLIQGLMVGLLRSTPPQN